MSDHGIKTLILEPKGERVAGLETNATAKPLFFCKPHCGLSELRAEINAQHLAAEPGPARDRAGGHAGAQPRSRTLEAWSIRIPSR